jgi:hypothetical protein
METAWHDAILYSRRLMHKEAAGIATEISTVSLVVAMRGVSKPFKRKRQK